MCTWGELANSTQKDLWSDRDSNWGPSSFEVTALFTSSLCHPVVENFLGLSVLESQKAKQEKAPSVYSL